MEYLKIDSEDFEDLLFQIENSFQVEFDFEEIHNNLSIKQIIDKVVTRLNLQEGTECSSQIVFFRLRQLISKKHRIKHSQISLETKLKEIFPFQDRRKSWCETFNDFDLKVPKLGPPMGVFLPAILTALISFFFIFGKNWIYGLSVFLISIIIIYLSSKFGKVLPCENLRELTTNIAKYDYRGTRTKVGTYNTKEINQTILKLFTDWLGEYEGRNVNLETKIDYIGK
jgi:hypothetical protein